MEKESQRTSNENKQQKLVVGLLVILGIAIFLFFLWQYLPDLIHLLKNGNQAEIEAYISHAGKNGLWILVTLQVLQTITVFFPGIPIYMVSGILYGKLWGTVICYITYVLTNSGVFAFSRKMQHSAQKKKMLKDETPKDLKLKTLLRNTAHPMVLVAALCVIPLIPNGLVPYIASGTEMSFRDFVKAVAVGCLPGIFLFVCCGELLMSKYFKPVITLMVIALVLMVITFLFKDKIMDWFVRTFSNKNESDSGGQK